MGGKAISLVMRGGVRATEKPGEYVCEGSQPGSTYVVQLGSEQSCTCRAGQCGRDCYHVHAAKLMAARIREQERGE